jgi:hypothetical protein
LFSVAVNQWKLVEQFERAAGQEALHGDLVVGDLFEKGPLDKESVALSKTGRLGQINKVGL